MPNTGKPSLGCHLCRARRVKCDLTRPGCVRCDKLGRPCPGYREEDELLFRNENVASFATNRNKDRRRGQAEPLPTGSDKAPDLSSSSTKGSAFPGPLGIESTHFEMGEREFGSHLGANTIFLPLCPQIQNPWKRHSINLLLNQYSAVLEGGRFYEGLDFLPDLYQETSEESCFVLATDVFTRAYIANRSHASTCTNELAQMYGRALSSTNAALADPVQCVQDETVMAVWLLANHEILVASPNDNPVPAPRAWHVHIQGLTSLLRLRGPGQFSTKRGRNIFCIIYTIIQTRCLIANLEFPEESEEWFEIIRADLQEYNQNFYMVSEYAKKVGSLCIQIHHTINHGTAEYLSSIFPVLVAQADAIENYVPALTHSDDPSSTSRSGDTFRVYYANMYRGTHSKLHHVLIYLFNHVEKILQSEYDPSSLQKRRNNSLVIIRATAQEIIDSAPDALGDPIPDGAGDVLPNTRPRCWADGLRLLWPLTMVSWSPCVLPHQRELAEAMRERIGYEMGIREALTTMSDQMRILRLRYRTDMSLDQHCTS